MDSGVKKIRNAMTRLVLSAVVLLATGTIADGGIQEAVGNPQTSPQNSLPSIDKASEIVIGVPHYAFGDAQVLIPLITETATTRTRSRLLGFAGSRTKAELEGNRATIRIENPTPEFILWGVDPTRFKLYRFEIDDDKRTVEIASAGPLNATMTIQESEVPVSITDCGASCFRLRVLAPLASGEYGFSPVAATEAFTFGIDSPPPDSDAESFGPVAENPEIMTNQDVVDLKQAGLSDSLIMAKINTSASNFKLNTDDIIALRADDISEAVIALMIEASNEDQ